MHNKCSGQGTGRTEKANGLQYLKYPLVHPLSESPPQPFGSQTMDERLEWDVQKGKQTKPKKKKKPTNPLPPKPKELNRRELEGAHDSAFVLVLICPRAVQVPRLASQGSAFPAMWRRMRRAMKHHMRTLRYPHPTELKSSSFWREGRETPRSNACPPTSLHRGSGQSPHLAFQVKAAAHSTESLKNGCLLSRWGAAEWAAGAPHKTKNACWMNHELPLLFLLFFF